MLWFTSGESPAIRRGKAPAKCLWLSGISRPRFPPSPPISPCWTPGWVPSFLPMKHGATIFRDPDMRRLRALAMVRDRIRGASYATLAKDFKMSEIQVQRVLSYAKKANLLVEAEDKILQELVPDAIASVKACITPRYDKDGNRLPVSDKEATIALRVLENALPGFGGWKNQAQGKDSGEEESLYAYVDRLRKEMVIDGTATPVGVIEGEVQKLLPARTESADSEGLSTPVDNREPEVAPTETPSPSGETRDQQS
jgi:hypothetical protein